MFGPLRRPHSRYTAVFAVFFGLGAMGADCGNSGTGTSDRTTYPEGPYGTDKNDVLENLSFETVQGGTLTFEDIFSDPDNKLLLLNTAAGWCTACREEQPKLQALHDDHSGYGLSIVVALFEDNNYQPANTGFAQGWIDEYGAAYDVVVDEPFVLSDYYDPSLTPLTMVVDLDTMTILLKQTGFPESDVQALIDARL